MLKKENWIDEYQNLLSERGLIGLDLETTGLNRNIEYERPTSAAILEANSDLDNPDVIINDMCRLPMHILPDAGALEITNINPIKLMDEELSLFDLTRMIADYLINNPNKIMATYNGASYDLIILRHTFFSSLYNPYLLSNGLEDRIHIDLYKVVQAIYCFAQTSIDFHRDVKGVVSLKQSLLAEANGIDPGDAHSAIDDVKVLLKLANLFKEKTPEIFFSAIASGTKKRAIEKMTNQLFFNYGEVKYKDRIAVGRTPTFICEDPSYSNNMVHFDLVYEPEDYLHMTSEEIAPLINKKNSPFFNIKANASPVILHPSLCEQNNLTSEQATERATMVQESNGFKNNIVIACDINASKRTPWETSPYSESQIYSQFIDKRDRLLSDAFLKDDNLEQRIEIMEQINDPRLIDFSKRIIAMEHSECDAKTRMYFQEFEAQRLLSEDDVPWRTLKNAWDSLEKVENAGKDNIAVIKATKKYYELIEKGVNS